MEIRYGIVESIGSRDRMEDAHAVWDDEETGIFSAEVYDGHGGSRAAIIASEILTPYFLHGSRGEQEKADATAFTAEALRDAYLATDRHIIHEKTDSGTAAATLYLWDGRFLAANVGDARIVIGEGRGATELTVDHKPDLPAEKARIEALGGAVVTYDVPRVQGSLAMSRSLGDAFFKPFVTAEPRIAEGFLGRRNDVAVIACDGIWDVLTSEEAVALARRAATPEAAASLLHATATDRGSTDNITVIVLDLRRHVAQCPRDRLHMARVLDRALATS
jgi:protein phosphatase 1L